MMAYDPASYTARDAAFEAMQAEAYERADRCRVHWKAIKDAAEIMRAAFEKLGAEGMLGPMIEEAPAAPAAYAIAPGGAPRPIPARPTVSIFPEEIDHYVASLARLDVSRTANKCADAWADDQWRAR